ncbi:hypothetical protein LTR70_008922, partial [Exophiala xenobiotica]
MAEEIVKLVLDYEIGQQIGVFQSDNPAYNDNTVRDVLTTIDPTETDYLSRRARCLGHVVNLAARDFMFGVDVNAFEFEVAGDCAGNKFNKAKCSRHRGSGGQED